MRIEHLHLAAYGHYQDAELDLSSAERGLVVVHGPNEAGKSTARRALVAALFGIERSTLDGHLVGVHGLRVGARLRAADGARLSFVRQGLSGLEGEDGSPLDAAVLDPFLGSIPRAAYARLFAIDHEELRRGSESLLDAAGEIGRLVFGASLGSGSVAAVLRRLDDRAAALFRDRGSAQRIPKALKAYRDGIRQARESRVRARDWEQLQHDVEVAAARLDGARGAFETARTEQLRLGRVRAARPLVARRRALVQELDELGTVASSQWAARASDALERYRQAIAAHDRADAERRDLADRVDEIEVPEAVLAAATTIDELVEGKGRYQKDVGDLPKRRTELEVAQQSVRAQLQRLGKATDDGQVVAESDLVAVEELAREQTALMAQARAADAELQRARERAEECRARLGALPEPPDVRALSRVLEVARPKVEIARGVATELAEQEALAREVANRAARLGLDALDRDQIEALAVPPSADVDSERDRRHGHRLQLEELDRALARHADALKAVQHQIDAAVSHAPDPGRLDAARRHRDEGWRIVRATLEGEPVDAAWAADRSLVEAYERAVTEADEAADERYDHADAIARIVQLEAQRDAIGQEGDTLRGRRRALTEADASMSAAWEARWSGIGVDAKSPEAMAQWLRDQQDLVVAVGRLRQAETRIAATTEDIGRRASELSQALAAVGEEPSSAELDLLVVQATEVVKEAQDATAAHREAEMELELAERELPEREAARHRSREALEKWQAEWLGALRPLHLAPSTSAEAATAAVAAHRGLMTVRSDVASLERRIEGIAADCRTYEERVTGVAAELGDGRAGGTPLTVVSELQRQLRGARTAQERRETIAGQLEEAETEARHALAEVHAARHSLEVLRRDASLPDADDDPGAGIDDAVDRARKAATRRQRLAEVDDTLLEQSDGLDIEQVEAEVLAAGDFLDGQLDSASTEVASLQKELESANTELADAHRALAAVTEAATAADLEQEAQTELALAAGFATEYTRTALAAEILRRTIAEYGERHRGPLVDRAAALLRLLTLGAFVDLVVDEDGEQRVLLAKRVGGELCGVGALSDGTRDQLYMALRLAGLEHQLAETSEPLPVVLDDVLVNFDDTRAAAALRAFSTLGERTQVLLFTHHHRVVEIAERELDPTAHAVVHLEPRRHEVPPASTNGRADGPAGPHEDGSAEARILAALQTAEGEALGKADLLERSGIADTQWPTAIRALVGSGRLVQEGQRRGARYRLAT